MSQEDVCAAQPFPRMEHAKPDWPSQDDFHLFWAGLHSKFEFAHHPSRPEGGAAGGGAHARGSTPRQSYFSPPESLREKLVAVLADSSGGSVLVTGYRGTGKTSLVNAGLEDLRRLLAERKTKPRRVIRVDVNLSTVTTAYDVLLLTQEALQTSLDTVLEEILERPYATYPPPKAAPPTEARRKGDAPPEARKKPDAPPEPAACVQMREKIAEEAKKADRLLATIRSFQEKEAHAATRGAQFDQWKTWRRGTAGAGGVEEVLFARREALAKQDNTLRQLLDRELQPLLEMLTAWDRWVSEAKCPALAQLQPRSKENQRSKPSIWGKLRDDLKEYRKGLQSVRTERNTARKAGLEPGPATPKEEQSGDARHVFEREGSSYYQSQLVDLVRRISELKLNADEYALQPAVVFVFDELDKLLPATQMPPSPAEPTLSQPARQARKLTYLQEIVAELKYFLSEAHSHQIFIAGKDVDDSWAEDQNKGEGLFESIFLANIYVSSISSVALDPCAAGVGQFIGAEAPGAGQPAHELQERKDFYLALARELGIQPHSWTYNTALLILPHLAEYEILQLLLRVRRRRKDARDATLAAGDPTFGKLEADLAQVEHWIRVTLRHITYAVDHSETEDPRTKREAWNRREATSERTCRRLRILLEYLTYKGRGIPRKILREFYTMVQPRSIVAARAAGSEKLGPAEHAGSVKYVIAFHQHVLQKMNFYAGIMEDFELTYAEMRGLNDKGRVSIFHVIDYMLKFYATGFSLRDLEYANFMTTREEFFPSRQLAALIVRALEGRRWRRKDSRSPEFRLLHSVAHDLGVMFLRYGPEQMELRHTHADFRQELERLRAEMADLQTVPNEQRLTPVHTILRYGRIQEMIGNHLEARLSYYRALRWLRGDLHRLEQTKWEAAARVRSEFPHHGPADGPLTMTAGFLQPFMGYMTEALLSSGRLHEEVGEYPAALQYYLEAELLHRTHAHLCLHWPDQPVPATAAPEMEDLAPTLLASLFPDVTWSPRSSEEPLKTGGDDRADAALRQFRAVLSPRGALVPLDLSRRIVSLSGGLVEALNHAAIAYSKMWERLNANDCLLRALYHLRVIEDYHGLVDQAYFIGQLMVRRRDFHAAAAWYLVALRFIDQIKEYADGTAGLQSGARWQTPSAAAVTHAHILAALGDIYFATGGLAFVPQATIDAVIKEHGVGYQGIATLQKQARHAVAEIYRKMRLPVFDDRMEEFFHTYSRFLYRSIGDTVSATEVYLCQSETRVETFCRYMTLLNQQGTNLSPEELRDARYGLLVTWRSFWRGARSLLFRQLSAPTGLTRDAAFEWGRVSGFRRMGNLLRLVGEILRELALYDADGRARQILHAQSRHSPNRPGMEGKAPEDQMRPGGGASRDLDSFYRLFVCAQSGSDHAPDDEVESVVMERLMMILKPGERLPTRAELQERLLDFWDEPGTPRILERVDVNRAAEDLRIIFAYVSDKRALLADELGPEIAPAEWNRNFNSVGPRSPLFRINGGDRASGAAEPALPLGFFLASHLQPGCEDNLRRDIRLLALSEKALISAYLAYRDCIPDYNYACAALAVGELYLVAFFKIGNYCKDATAEEINRNFQHLALPLDRFFELAKRFILKAIDILKREREQNRNTFHLISEALFNLGDLLLIRLALLPELARKWKLFGECSLDEVQMWRATDQTTPLDGALGCAGDRVAEDLRRQIWDAYTQGLVLVQNEIDEYSSRFRAPPEAYYAYRNLMDPVLHFRIAKAARRRHLGGRPVIPSRDFTPQAGFDPTELQKEWEQISRHISTHQSPQRHTSRWLEHLQNLHKQAKRVRSDRSPLQFEGNKLCWVRTEELTHRRLLLFHEFSRIPEEPGGAGQT